MIFCSEGHLKLSSNRGLTGEMDMTLLEFSAFHAESL